MKAIQYLHSKYIYYGDMKPSNILIFQNMQVKLGDFGTAEKFEDMSSILYLRGATKFFCDPSIWKKINEGTEVSVKEALKNDYYCLWKTFEWTLKELNLPPESLFF